MTNIERRARIVAKSMARLVFDKRGNHSEAHISEAELAAYIAAAYELGHRWNGDRS